MRDSVQGSVRGFIASIDWRILLAAIGTAAAGDSVMGYMPLFVGAAVDDLSVSYAAAGWITSLEIGAGALALMVLSPFTGIVKRKHFAYAGLAVFITGAVIAMVGETYLQVMAGRTLLGFGAGTVATMNAACFGAARNPERTIAVIMVCGLAYMSGAIRLASEMVEQWGLAGAYGTHLLFAVGGGVLYFLIPKAPREGAPWREAFSGADNTVKKGGGTTLLPMLVIGAFFVMGISESAVWSFVERKGVAIGMSASEAGGVISFGFLMGIAGSLTAIVLGARLGRALPVATGMALFVGGILVSFGAQDAGTYRIGVVMWFLGFTLMMPYITGTLAQIDKEGRFVAMSASGMIFANALGPSIGGFVMDAGSVDLVRIVIPVVVGACACVMVPVIFRLDRAIKTANAAV
ncbi:MAG: MFS transporter [Alphaproteobacteria bacterium]